MAKTKLVSMNIPPEVLERIDAEAKRLKLSRTALFIARCDPAVAMAKPVVVSPAQPEKAPQVARGRKAVNPEPAGRPFVNRLKGHWKAP